jgi:putative oxidoreductase
MITGFLTRPIAVLLVIEFAVIVYHHIPNGYAWIVRGSEYPLFWGGLLFVVIAIRGGGPYSVDRAIGREV